MRIVFFMLLTLVLSIQNQASAQNIFDFIFGKPQLEAEWTYETGEFDEGAAEIVAFDAETARVFVTNGNDGGIDVLEAATGAKIGFIAVDDLGAPTSVATSNGLVAVAVDSGDVSVKGNVIFAKADSLERTNVVEVGFLPDMLTFTPDGKKVVVANEGEPNDDYTIDPEGSISIISVRSPKKAKVKEATFTKFNSKKDKLKASGVRIFGPGATVAQDLEPEYITISANSRYAYVSLQENNAIAVVKLASAKVLSIAPLGFKDHTKVVNAFDASNRDDAINIQTWPTKGMYQPDSIASLKFFGSTLVVTANEGDARDYDGFSEEERVKDLDLDPTKFPTASTLQKDENLGRLKTTTANGDTDGDGDFDEIYSYGARSFSIWAIRGKRAIQIYDSGNDFEEITAALIPDDFNSTDDENESFDSRSDDKGPEPEALAVGYDLLQSYSFIGLERVGGIMLYEVTNPFAPRFIQYKNNRDFGGDAEAGTAGDLAPEGIVFVPRGDSPFVEPSVIVANEISGTTTLYRAKRVGGILSHLFNE